MSTSQALVLCACIGLLDTLYLMWHKIRGTDVACIGFPKEWCRTVQYAKQAKTFGVPNSILGFLMYAAIFLLVSFSPTLPFIAAGTLVTLLVLVGFLFSLYFMYVQAFVLHAFCTWCVISFINFAVMAWVVFIR